MTRTSKVRSCLSFRPPGKTSPPSLWIDIHIRLSVGYSWEPLPPIDYHPSPPPPPFLPGTSPALMLRTSFMTAFAAPHFPSALPMNTFGTPTNHVLNTPPHRFASVRLVLLMRGGGGEALRVRYLGFHCRAGVAAGPGASARKAGNVSKSNVPNCSKR